jgi:hypothetical protein
MAAPTILTSDDVGAPTLSGEDGKLYDVLKWALPLLGWSIEFDDSVNFRAAFRNDTLAGGTGGYLRVVDKAADIGLDARFTQLNAYETMSDVDTGTRKAPNTDVSYWAKSVAANSTTRKWRIWGDKYRFVFAVWADTDVNDARILVFYAGDLVTLDPADSVFVIKHGTTATTMNNSLVYPYLASAGQAGHAMVRSKDGLSGPVPAHLFGTNPSHTAPTWSSGESGSYVDPVSGNPLFTRLVISDGSMRRGYMPGMYLPIGAWRTGLGSAYGVVAGCNTPDGTHDLLHVSSTQRQDLNSSSPMSYLIDETDGWGDV